MAVAQARATIIARSSEVPSAAATTAVISVRSEASDPEAFRDSYKVSVTQLDSAHPRRLITWSAYICFCTCLCADCSAQLLRSVSGSTTRAVRSLVPLRRPVNAHHFGAATAYNLKNVGSVSQTIRQSELQECMIAAAQGPKLHADI
jgi:hypothetical protein